MSLKLFSDLRIMIVLVFILSFRLTGPNATNEWFLVFNWFTNPLNYYVHKQTSTSSVNALSSETFQSLISETISKVMPLCSQNINLTVKSPSLIVIHSAEWQAQFGRVITSGVVVGRMTGDSDRSENGLPTAKLAALFAGKIPVTALMPASLILRF